ncbi:MAG: glycosyltransferase [Acidobacteriota bacterium]
MNDTSHLDRENRKLEHRLEKLREQLKDLTDDNRDLHRQMAAVIDRLSASATNVGDTVAPPLALPPPAPTEGLMTRALRKGLRMAAGAVRTLRRATDPGADMVRLLAAVTDPSPARDLPIIGEDILLNLAGDTDPATIGALDLPWLFALEGIDAAWIRLPGHEVEVLAARRDLHQTLRDHGWAGLAQAATDLGRAVIAKRLPCPSAPEGKEWLLHPVHLDDHSTVWRNASYLVGLPKNVRRAELRLNTTDPPVLPEQPADLFILISEPLVEGLEQRLATGLKAVGDLSRMIVSLAPWTEAGTRRLNGLSSNDTPVHDFGSILHPATWDTAGRSLLQSAQSTTLWAIGHGNTLDPLIARARQDMPSLRVVGEAVDAGTGPRTADTTIVRTKAQHERLEGTPGIGALHLAPTPLVSGSAQSAPEIRRTLGVPADATLVVVAGDLTASSRAEDAAAVARTLGQSKDIWFRVVGRGPLAPAIDDLGRLFGLERFALSNPDHGLEDIVAAADVVCCLDRCEVLPPAASIAVASGVPMVAPASGEAVDLAESGIEGIHLGGTAGDAEALADALLEAIAAGTPAPGATGAEIINRAERTGRIYREALTDPEK